MSQRYIIQLQLATMLLLEEAGFCSASTTLHFALPVAATTTTAAFTIGNGTAH